MSIDQMIARLEELKLSISGETEIAVEYDFEGDTSYFTSIEDIFETKIQGEETDIVVVLLKGMDDDSDEDDTLTYIMHDN